MGKTSRRAFLRGWVALTGALALASVVGACAPKAEPTAPPTTPAEKPATPKPAVEKEVIELVEWNGLAGPDGEIWMSIVERYNQGPGKEAGIYLKSEIYEANVLYTKAMATYGAGEPIDILLAGATNTAVMVGKDMLAPLDDLMSGVGVGWNDFYPSTIDTFTFEGKRYCVPTEVSNYTIFFNTDHAEEAGLDVSSFPKDKEGFIEWAKAVTKIKDDTFEVTGLVIPGSGGLPYRWWFQGLYQNEGSLLSEDLRKAAFNTDAGKEACQFVLDCFDTHKVSNRELLDARKAFKSLYGSIIQDGSWMGPAFAEQEGLNFDSAMLPVYGHKLFGYAITMGEVVMRHDPEEPGRLDAVANWLKWRSEDPAWNFEVPTVPVRKLHGENPKIRGMPYMAPFIDMVPYGVEAPPIAEYGELSGRITEILDTVWSKDISIDEGLAKAEEQVDEILAG